MGNSRFSPTDWDSFSTTRTMGKSTAHVFTASSMVNKLDPINIKVREARDSIANPLSTPLIIGLDVTGSMGMIADHIARDGLFTLFKEIYDRKPVTDPAIMFMGIGDVTCDQAPLQVSQFESDIRLADQLTDLWLEHGGGGNFSESYTLPWYFAALKTSTDAFDKRGKKGYLFTVGDEEIPEKLTVNQIERVLGVGPQADLSASQLLDMVSRMYHVFHVIVEEGSHARSYPGPVKASWTKVLGQRVLPLKDYRKLSEVIVSTIQITEGLDAKAVAMSWSGDTSLVVAHATGALTQGSGGGGLVMDF